VARGADWILMSAPVARRAPAPVWPDGVTCATWRDTDATDVHAVMAAAYRDGGGTVAPLAEWAPAFMGDAEFDAATCFIARRVDTAIVGVCLCWSSAFVKDLCVHPSARRQGLGQALMRTALRTFADRGHTEVSLKVEADNTRAIRLYEALGFRRTMEGAWPASEMTLQSGDGKAPPDQ
jgi:ribosomal protein S18 acetylase RimI-like enzyme